MKVLQDKVVLIIGGTGSMGKTFVRRALSGVEGMPKKLIVMSRDEAKQHYMRLAYMHAKNATDEVIYRNFQNLLQFRIGDIRNYSDVLAALKGVDVVINAAALKQVPTCEYFPDQAIHTNCIGVHNLVSAIHNHQLPIETVVGISTDKACKPINVMGMTKAVQERIYIAANVYNSNTRFVCVRYGNVLASRGSVIPLFHEQIRKGGPVTITHPEMTRFLLSLEDAVDTVLEAMRHGFAGETFIPKAPAAKVTDIAKALVGTRGLETKIVGIRPGEKLHESLVSFEEAFRTRLRGDYYVILPMLPEIQNQTALKGEPLVGEYSSKSPLMNLSETITLLKKHNLLEIADAEEESREMIG